MTEGPEERMFPLMVSAEKHAAKEHAGLPVPGCSSSQLGGPGNQVAGVSLGPVPAIGTDTSEDLVTEFGHHDTIIITGAMDCGNADHSVTNA